MNARWLVRGGGAGDTIQFARYIPLAVVAGIDVTLACDPALHRLLSLLGATLIDDAFGRHYPAGPIDMPFMLAAHRGEPVPANYRPGCTDGFLSYVDATNSPPPARLWVNDAVRAWPATDKVRVGVCWASNDEHRRVHPQTLIENVSRDGVEVVSLQVGAFARATDTKGKPLDDLVSIDTLARDWADSAAYVQQCDAVVTVDTGLAHLSATLGVPTFMLLPSRQSEGQLKRWSTGTTTPWYPAMRIYRDYGASLEQELAALRASKHLSTRRRLPAPPRPRPALRSPTS